MNELVKRTEVFNCYSEAAALDLIEQAKEDKTCVVEHAIKYKAKKDRKTGRTARYRRKYRKIPHAVK